MMASAGIVLVHHFASLYKMIPFDHYIHSQLVYFQRYTHVPPPPAESFLYFIFPAFLQLSYNLTSSIQILLVHFSHYMNFAEILYSDHCLHFQPPLSSIVPPSHFLLPYPAFSQPSHVSLSFLLLLHSSRTSSRPIPTIHANLSFPAS